MEEKNEIEYHTDTEFEDSPEKYVENHSRKKRRVKSPLNQEDKANEENKKKTNKKRNVNTSPEKVEEEPETHVNYLNKERKEKPPPPIIISEVANYDSLLSYLESEQIQAKINVRNNKNIKLNVATQMDYRKITKDFTIKGISWYTYENKGTRPIRVMAKGIHPTCDPTGIIADVANKGLKILDATNILSKQDKFPLDMFMLNFEHDENIKKVFEIKEIRGARVQIENVRKTKLIPQCKKDQSFEHTHKYSNLAP